MKQKLKNPVHFAIRQNHHTVQHQNQQDIKTCICKWNLAKYKD